MVKYEARLDAVFMALAHPARRAMLAQPARREATAGELAQPLDISLPESAPLKAGSGWIEQRREIRESRLDRLEGRLHSLEQREERENDTE